MNGIRFSVDIWHQEFVPIQSVKNAIRAVCEAGILPELSIMETKDRRVIQQVVEALRPELYFAQSVIYYPVLLPGKTCRTQAHGLTDQDIMKACDVKNPVCIGLETVAFYTDGKAYPCCSQFSFEIPKISLGRFGEDSLAQIINRLNRDPILEMMQRGGLRWFADEARTRGVPMKDCYSNDCELCRDLLNNADFLSHIEKKPLRKRSACA